MTTRDEIAKKVNFGYVDVYLKRRNPDGSYDADWLDVSRYVLAGTRQVDQSLDSGDYDLGVRTIGSHQIVLSNKSGKFCEAGDPRSLWAALDTRHLSLIKIEAGYLDTSTDWPRTKIEEIAFIGLMSEQAIETGSNDNVRITLLAREYVFKNLTVIPGTFNSPVTVSDAVLLLCSRGEVLDLISVDAANISPGNDFTIDLPSAFEARKLDEVLNELMLLSNSVLFVDQDGNLRVRDRQHTVKYQYQFRFNSESGKANNIYRITNVNSGRQRVKNYFVWSDKTAISQSAAHHLKRYGVTRKSVGSDAITTLATKQSILNALRTEWQFPKQEMEIETDYLANELTFFDMVQLDIRPPLSRREDLPICGSAVAGEARCAAFAAGLYVDSTLGYKVLGIKHDLKDFRTTLKLRLKGNQLNDGYVAMPTSKHLTVAFAAETTKDVNLSAYGMRAQRTIVQVIDENDDFATIGLKVTRPNENTVRLTAGAAITATVTVLLSETED